MAKRKPDPNIKPQSKLLIISIVLLVVGILWSIYELNPFGAIRSLTEHEKKELQEAKTFKAEQERAQRMKKR
ncbi:MAG: hypothetical protein V1899_11975 [Planctomycetota bacterium]